MRAYLMRLVNARLWSRDDFYSVFSLCICMDLGGLLTEERKGKPYPIPVSDIAIRPSFTVLSRRNVRPRGTEPLYCILLYRLMIPTVSTCADSAEVAWFLYWQEYCEVISHRAFMEHFFLNRHNRVLRAEYRLVRFRKVIDSAAER